MQSVISSSFLLCNKPYDTRYYPKAEEQGWQPPAVLWPLAPRCPMSPVKKAKCHDLWLVIVSLIVKWVRWMPNFHYLSLSHYIVRTLHTCQNQITNLPCRLRRRMLPVTTTCYNNQTSSTLLCASSLLSSSSKYTLFPVQSVNPWMPETWSAWHAEMCQNTRKEPWLSELAAGSKLLTAKCEHPSIWEQMHANVSYLFISHKNPKLYWIVSFWSLKIVKLITHDHKKTWRKGNQSFPVTIYWSKNQNIVLVQRLSHLVERTRSGRPWSPTPGSTARQRAVPPRAWSQPPKTNHLPWPRWTMMNAKAAQWQCKAKWITKCRNYCHVNIPTGRHNAPSATEPQPNSTHSSFRVLNFRGWFGVQIIGCTFKHILHSTFRVFKLRDWFGVSCF